LLTPPKYDGSTTLVGIPAVHLRPGSTDTLTTKPSVACPRRGVRAASDVPTRRFEQYHIFAVPLGKVTTCVTTGVAVPIVFRLPTSNATAHRAPLALVDWRSDKTTLLGKRE
jgi:hypothetical protein